MFLLLNTVSTLVQLGSVRNPLQGVFAVVIAAALLSLFGLLFVWLVQAVRATSAIRLARMQFQSQYWQYQQQQQMYAQQGGYGYPQPPPPQLPPNESGERPNGPATPG